MRNIDIRKIDPIKPVKSVGWLPFNFSIEVGNLVTTPQQNFTSFISINRQIDKLKIKSVNFTGDLFLTTTQFTQLTNSFNLRADLLVNYPIIGREKVLFTDDGTANFEAINLSLGQNFVDLIIDLNGVAPGATIFTIESILRLSVAPVNFALKSWFTFVCEYQ